MNRRQEERGKKQEKQGLGVGCWGLELNQGLSILGSNSIPHTLCPIPRSYCFVFLVSGFLLL